MVSMDFSFNHKTGAENVHFTTELSNGDSDNDTDNNDEGKNTSDDKPLYENSCDDGNSEDPSYLRDDSKILETIIVKSVKAGDEVSFLLLNSLTLVNFLSS